MVFKMLKLICLGLATLQLPPGWTAMAGILDGRAKPREGNGFQAGELESRDKRRQGGGNDDVTLRGERWQIEAARPDQSLP